jgi:hypothetical protein
MRNFIIRTLLKHYHGDQIMKIKWIGHVAHMGEMRNAYKALIRKPEGNRPLRKPRRRWEGNIRGGLREMGWEVMEWMYLTKDRVQ